jgi:hypothetical protein
MLTYVRPGFPAEAPDAPRNRPKLLVPWEEITAVR